MGRLCVRVHAGMPGTGGQAPAWELCGYRAGMWGVGTWALLCRALGSASAGVAGQQRGLVPTGMGLAKS